MYVFYCIFELLKTIQIMPKIMAFYFILRNPLKKTFYVRKHINILLTFPRHDFISKYILSKLLLHEHFARMLKCDSNLKCVYGTTPTWIVEPCRANYLFPRKRILITLESDADFHLCTARLVRELKLSILHLRTLRRRVQRLTRRPE